MDQNNTKYAIARKMLTLVMVDNDMVNKDEAPDKKLFEFWVKKTEDALAEPFEQMGEGYFSDEWMDDFCTGGKQFQEGEIRRHKSLEKVLYVLDDFFRNYGKTDFDIEFEKWCEKLEDGCRSIALIKNSFLKDTARHFAEWQIKRDSAMLAGEWDSGYQSGLESSEDLADELIDKVCEWLKTHVRQYINSEYNEFHHEVEYDGTIDKERMVADLKKYIETDEN